MLQPVGTSEQSIISDANQGASSTPPPCPLEGAGAVSADELPDTFGRCGTSAAPTTSLAEPPAPIAEVSHDLPSSVAAFTYTESKPQHLPPSPLHPGSAHCEDNSAFVELQC